VYTHLGSGLQEWPSSGLRPIGCLKLQVIVRKRAANYRALLRKMTCKDKASYASSFWKMAISPETSEGNVHISDESARGWSLREAND